MGLASQTKNGHSNANAPHCLSRVGVGVCNEGAFFSGAV